MLQDEGDALLLEPVTEQIIGCAFRVANALGAVEQGELLSLATT